MPPAPRILPRAPTDSASAALSKFVEKTHDLDALTGLRGICCSLIFVGHFLTFFSDADSYPVLTIEYLMPVTVFFALSGYSLGVTHLSADQGIVDRKLFGVKRLARLLPVYFGSLLIALPCLIVFAFHNHPPPACAVDDLECLFPILKENCYDFKAQVDIFDPLVTGWEGLKENVIFALTFLQPLALKGLKFNGQVWQVSALLICFIGLPTFGNWLIRRSRKTIEWVFVAFSVISIALFEVVGYYLRFAPLVHLAQPFRFWHFYMGVCVAVWSKKSFEAEETETSESESNSESDSDSDSSPSLSRRSLTHSSRWFGANWRDEWCGRKWLIH